MSEQTMSYRFGGAFPEIRAALTQKQTWIAVLAIVTVLIFEIRWPTVSQFTFLCVFPGGMFCYAAIRAGAFHKAPIRKMFIIVGVIHVLLLSATFYIWHEDPKTVNGDFEFGFVMIEFVVIAILWFFDRRNAGQGVSLQ